MHMIRKKRGRPESTSRPFVEQCARLVAHSSQIRAAVARRCGTSRLIVSGLWVGRDGRQPFAAQVHVVPTRQPIAGYRWWWRCLTCGRRCRVLLLSQPDSAPSCRRCLGCVYQRDYPSRWRRYCLRQRLGLEGGGPLDQLESLERLCAPRRRGVRRGRRVGARARQLACHLLAEYGYSAEADASQAVARARIRLRLLKEDTKEAPVRTERSEATRGTEPGASE